VATRTKTVITIETRKFTLITPIRVTSEMTEEADDHNAILKASAHVEEPEAAGIEMDLTSEIPKLLEK
jgi:hypothetical protein